MEIVISWKDGVPVTCVTSSRTMFSLIYSNKAIAFSEHDIYYYLLQSMTISGQQKKDLDID